MKISDCNHLRIRDSNAYGTDVEEFIKSIEKQHKIDFRSLPQWQDIVKRMHVMTTDYKRKIQDANRRKHVIMSKIFIEATRESPFELTDKLARTYNKWQVIASAKKSRRLTLVPEPDVVESTHDTEIIGEISENASTAHHNTEIPDLPTDLQDRVGKSDAETETKFTERSGSPLPVKICLNPHKLISPLQSHDVVFEYGTLEKPSDTEIHRQSKEWLLLKETKSVKCFPKEIFITSDSLNAQTIKFSIINCNTDYMNIRFMSLTNDFPFKVAKITPDTPKRLYPGIAITYKFRFKLFQNLEEFTSALYFRVGQNVLGNAPAESLCVPVISQFKFARSVSVSKAVYTPPAYLWQIRQVSGFPAGTLKIRSNDNYSYHVHIIKRIVNISRECQDSIVSIDVISPNTESFIDRIEDDEIESQSKALVSRIDAQMETVQTIDIISLVMEDLVDLALDTFVFDQTYFFLQPHCEKVIDLHFTKPERIGSHHSYYDIEFSDSETEELIMTKTVKVFAEVLPHPIRIYPRILDMSQSPVNFGFCEDDIVISNTHRLYPVTIKFKLTTKMRKLFCVTPIESLVPAKSSMHFRVRLCSTDLSNKSEDLAHFTIKIIVSGEKSVYANVEPIFYEIIAPCASEFLKIYNENYFKDTCDPFDKP